MVPYNPTQQLKWMHANKNMNSKGKKMYVPKKFVYVE